MTSNEIVLMTYVTVLSFLIGFFGAVIIFRLGWS
jgi:hypothetical protein